MLRRKLFSSPDKTGKRSERGFSVIEMTVVLMVIAILAAFIVPQILTYMKRYRLTVASRNVATALQRARYIATSNNSRAGILFSEQQRLDIELYDPEGEKEPQNKGMIHLPAGVHISSDAPERIAFDGRGVITPMPKENPRIRLNGESGYYQLVTVSPTGQVTVSDMHDDGA